MNRPQRQKNGDDVVDGVAEGAGGVDRELGAERNGDLFPLALSAAPWAVVSAHDLTASGCRTAIHMPIATSIASRPPPVR